MIMTNTCLFVAKDLIQDKYQVRVVLLLTQNVWDNIHFFPVFLITRKIIKSELIQLKSSRIANQKRRDFDLVAWTLF